MIREALTVEAIIDGKPRPLEEVRKEHQERQERQEALLRDYPDNFWCGGSTCRLPGRQSRPDYNRLQARRPHRV
ncbi:MAG: hypothetical protein K2X35_04565 [Bryobacteraceae bacterium]|nr:hypothetical protein [Bryobacteraceae bacterium]